MPAHLADDQDDFGKFGALISIEVVDRSFELFPALKRFRILRECPVSST